MRTEKDTSRFGFMEIQGFGTFGSSIWSSIAVESTK